MFVTVGLVLDVFRTLAAVITAGCWGEYTWKKQKRIENSCVNAKEALGVYKKVEASIRKADRMTIVKPGITTPEHQENAINELIFSLGEFRSILFFLSYNSKVKPILDWIEEVLKEFAEATFPDGEKIKPYARLIHGLAKIGLDLKTGQVEFKKLEKIKNILLKIYGIR